MHPTTPPVLVHCINCGGDSSLALIGVIIAGAAFLVAVAAAWYAKGQHKIAEREHDEFMKQLTARARFELSAGVLNSTEHNIIETGPHTTVIGRVEIVLRNVGARAAGPTVVSALIPAGLRRLDWTTRGGVSIGRESAPADERLPLMDGSMVDAQIVVANLPRVALRTPERLYVAFTVDPGVTEVPLRVKAQSDDLPDEQDEEVFDFQIGVRFSPP